MVGNYENCMTKKSLHG